MTTTPAPLRLGLNLDHVATLRNARGGAHPDPVRFAHLALEAGADAITVHLREDRRHIRDADVERLMAELTAPLNLEMAVTAEMVAIARRLRPHAVCLVPEKRQEVTTEGGLDAVGGGAALAEAVAALTRCRLPRFAVHRSGAGPAGCGPRGWRTRGRAAHRHLLRDDAGRGVAPASWTGCGAPPGMQPRSAWSVMPDTASTMATCGRWRRIADHRRTEHRALPGRRGGRDRPTGSSAADARGDGCRAARPRQARGHSMKIAILGAGGVGGYFGARLAAHGNDVTFIARGAHAAAMRANGLRVLSGAGDLHLQPVQLHEDALQTGLVDIVLVAVKMYDLDAAAAIIKPLLNVDTAVVPFQNGVEAAGHSRAQPRPPLCLRRGRLYRRRDRGAGRDPPHRQHGAAHVR